MIYTFWLDKIKFTNKHLVLFANTLSINLKSALRKDLDLQFYVTFVAVLSTSKFLLFSDLLYLKIRLYFLFLDVE